MPPRGRGVRKDAPPPAPTGFTVDPPQDVMLALLTDEMPFGDGWMYEPKWDGFRAIVYKDGERIYTQSRDLRPLDRYFPELHAPFIEYLPERIVVDGEIVIAGKKGLDFDALQLRLHPAASRVAKLAQETPSSFVAFDLLALGDRDVRGETQEVRRKLLEEALARVEPPIHVTPMTRDRKTAEDWFERFEGAGFDGVIARPIGATYQSGKRVLAKIKHARTADCAVAGFRWHKNGPGTLVGSLLLGLFDEAGTLHHVGVTSSFTMAERKELAAELEPYRKDALAEHPWRQWAEMMQGAAEQGQRMPGGGSRWNAGKDLSWEPLRLERVAEVKYDQLQGDRFRHGATFLRWRPDRTPSSCSYAQLEVTPPEELSKIFRSG